MTQATSRKLLEHFKGMQALAERYLIPEQYVSLEGLTSADEHHRAVLFSNDMLYMLDGPEQRDAQASAELVVSQGYPTEDAYMRNCLALHWRTEELRQAGIEPLNLMALNGGADIPHYPPEHFRFPITEAFPGDDHRQIYHGWRRYPQAMRYTMIMGAMLGCVVGILLTLGILYMRGLQFG